MKQAPFWIAVVILLALQLWQLARSGSGVRATGHAPEVAASLEELHRSLNRLQLPLYTGLLLALGTTHSARARRRAMVGIAPFTTEPAHFEQQVLQICW